MNQLGRLVLILFLAGAAAAAEVRLGPEQALAPIGGPGPAAYQQYHPSAASNGRDYYAVWVDSRDSRTRSIQLPTEGTIYGTRIDWAGRPLEPFGRVLAAEGKSPVIASDGEDFLVAWHDGRGLIYVQRIDRNGEPVGAAQQLAKQRYAAQYLKALKSTGNTYLLIVNNYIITHLYSDGGYLLDRDGRVISDFTAPGSLSDPWAADTRAGTYQLFAYREGGSLFLSVDEAGRAESRTLMLAPPKVPAGYYQATAMAGDRILVARSDIEGNIAFAMYDTGGNVVRFPASLAVPAEIVRHAPAVRIVTDGHEFLLLLYSVPLANESSVPLWAYRIDANGSVKNAMPYVLAYGDVQLAGDEASALLLWSDFRYNPAGDLFARTIHGFAALEAPAEQLIAFSGDPQVAADLAVAQSRTIGVWYNQTRNEIRGVVDGREFTVARGTAGFVGAPAVAAGNDQFLIAWPELEPAMPSAKVLARRYALDGAPLDATPIVLSGDLPAQWSGPIWYDLAPTPRFAPRPGILFDGSSYLISLLGRDDLRIARIDARTGAAGLSTYPVPGPDLLASIGALAKTAADLLVPYCTLSGCFLMRVDGRSGGARHIPLPGVGRPFSPHELANERVTFFDDGYRRLRQVTLEGAPLPGQWTLPDALVERDVVIRWNGSEYVVAWTANHRVRAIRLDRDLQPLDAAPFEVSPEGSSRFLQPAIDVTPEGVIIAYSRSVEENGRAPRVFTRTLDRLPSVTRRQSVRH